MIKSTQNTTPLRLSLWQGLNRVHMASLVMCVLLLLFSYAPAFAMSEVASAPEANSETASPEAYVSAPEFAEPTLSVLSDADAEAFSGNAQKHSTVYKISSKIHFERSQTNFNTTYMDNAAQLKAIKHLLDSISAKQVVSVNVIGSASPEGTLKFNTYLAKTRAARLKNYLVRNYSDFFVSDLDWNVSYEYEDWSYVEELLAQSNIEYRDEALDIIKNTPYNVYDANGKLVTTRKKTLMALHDGSVWKEMDAKIFPYSRGAELQIIVRAAEEVAEEVAEATEDETVTSEVPTETEVAELPDLVTTEVDDIPEIKPVVAKDSVQLYTISSKIHFERSKISFNDSYMDNAAQLQEIKHVMDSISAMEVVGVNVIGSSSPEGTLKYNTYLANNRAACLKDYLVNANPDFFNNSLNWNVSYENEDWSYVAELLEQSDIAYRDEALDIIKNTPYEVRDSKGRVVSTRKQKLKALHGGSVWKEMDEKIFPYSRGAELQIIVKAPTPVDTLTIDTICYEIESQPSTIENCRIDTLIPAKEIKDWRQPMLAVKTNLLFYGAYIPKYGFAPAPNIGLEFLPRHGHWTVGASLDIPWYRNYKNHKFFQIRNWQIEARRYFRKNDAQYWGWYAQVYVHTGVFGIGFNKEQGWEGESVGAGIGGGYVLPISKNKHWKLEFNLQLGYMRTQYDPYVYGHPTNGEEDGLYYYNWTHDPDLFKERQYRHNWLGPTRVGVTLSYDLLYYPRKKSNR